MSAGCGRRIASPTAGFFINKKKKRPKNRSLFHLESGSCLSSHAVASTVLQVVCGLNFCVRSASSASRPGQGAAPREAPNRDCPAAMEKVAPKVLYSIHLLTINKEKETEIGLFLFWNPAAAYPPMPSPAQYFRCMWA